MAAVEVLAASVRVLQVGNRQVTQSVYRQLDYLPVWDMHFFGRVRAAARPLHGEIELVGVDRKGNLVKSNVMRQWAHQPPQPLPQFEVPEGIDWRKVVEAAEAQPLIVLGGLK
ncbi:hypothetical protein SEA_SCARLETT_63 [Mycobacterium phage Scarlett]|nr:hypothetical protein SEA_SCARLETT_63 [Mycobacterium phage Scarlett]